MIADYSELIAEVTERSGFSGLANRAKMLTGLLEVFLNKELRISNMETATTLTTDANGSVALPSDYVSIRSISKGGLQIPRKTSQIILADVLNGYYINGSNIASTYPSADLDVVYYAKVPALAENSTNWLLTRDPEIYIVGLLWQVARFQRDFEGAVALKAELASMIDELQTDDTTKVYQKTQVSIQGYTP